MKFFIDETGQFKDHGDLSEYEYFVAVGISDELLIILEKQYGDKDKKFLRQNSEDLMKLLSMNNFRIFAIGHNANVCSKELIEEHKKNYIDSIYKAVENHPVYLQESAKHHAEILSKVGSDLYIKALLMIRLLESILRGICIESKQFLQYDLTCFDFICDTMPDSIESTIRYFSLFSIFCRSSENPIQFDTKDNLKHLIHEDGKYFAATSFFKNINFVQSKSSVGVRVADVLVNQLFRIVDGRSTDYNKHTWKKFFSNPYSLEHMHFNEDCVFIYDCINDAASVFFDSINK